MGPAYRTKRRTKEPYAKEYILQKRPIIFRSLLIVATPCMYIHIYRILPGRWDLHIGQRDVQKKPV